MSLSRLYPPDRFSANRKGMIMGGSLGALDEFIGQLKGDLENLGNARKRGL
jgi:hypothetical protein